MAVGSLRTRASRPLHDEGRCVSPSAPALTPCWMMRRSNGHEWSLGLSGLVKESATVEQQDEADGRRRRTRDGLAAPSRGAARDFSKRRPQLILVFYGFQRQRRGFMSGTATAMRPGLALEEAA